MANIELMACEIPWSPSLTLPSEWQKALGVPHPTPINEPGNLAATPLRGSCETDAHRVIEPVRSTPNGLSHAQAEAVVAACAALRVRPYGFCLGDGTGVGKGRTISAIILERLGGLSGCARWHGQTAVWVTTSQTLWRDAMRDLEAVCPPGWAERAIGSGALTLTTYRRLVGSHLVHIQEDLAHAGERGTLVFDEAHAARNPRSISGAAVRALQEIAPKAGVVYSTATIASSAGRMGYMDRLGLWDEAPGRAPFVCHRDFESSMSDTHDPAAAMELVAMDLKRRGRLVARSLGHGNCTVASITADLPTTWPCEATPPAISAEELYDQCAAFFAAHCRNTAKSIGFFGRLIVALKSDFIARRAREHVASGKRVIVSLQCTGDSAAREGERGGALGATLRQVIESAHERSTAEGLAAMNDAERLYPLLPREPLQWLREALDDLGVAMLTGTNAKLGAAVVAFQTGAARVALLTAAATQGISLHDVGTPGPALRVHMLAQVPWSSEDFAQQCGRACRTGQVTEPRYEVIVSPLPAENRWTHAVTSRLRGMGAITRGDAESAGAPAASGLRAALGDVSVRLIVRLALCRTARAVAMVRRARGRRGPLGPDAASWLATGASMHWLSTHHGSIGRAALRIICTPPAEGGTGNLYTASHADVSNLLEALPDAERSVSGPHATTAWGCTVPSAPWCPRTHFYHGPRARRTIETVLLCANRPGTPMYGLPRDVVVELVRSIAASFVSDWGTDDDAAEALSGLLQRGAEAPPITDGRSILNASLTMAVRQQRALWKLVAQARSFQRERGDEAPVTVSLERYVLRERTADMVLRARGVPAPSAAPTGAHGLEVTVRYTERDDPLPEWIAAGRVVVLGRSWQWTPFVIITGEPGAPADHAYELWHPGRATKSHARATVDGMLGRWQPHAREIFTEPGDIEKNASEGSGWHLAWKGERKRFVTVGHATAKRLCCTLWIATDDALSFWTRSTRRVLRCTSPAVERPFTALLLRGRRR